MNRVLVSPLYDPDARLAQQVLNNGDKLFKIYAGNIFVSISHKTSEETERALEKVKIPFITSAHQISLGENYRRAIAGGLKLQASHIHLVDFDRALHWAQRYPDELRRIDKEVEKIKGFISFVRTRRAFESHPLIQRTTETAVNAIATEIVGMDVDIMSGSFGFDRKLAEEIMRDSRRNDFGIYAEFLTIALKHKKKINVIEVEGLEWETPDQFQDKIEKEGYSAWLEEFESLPEWKKRIRLMEESAEVMI
ncbi:MAG: hypothetical protein AAB521_03785 [Patescibacteria group bacterium]